MRRSVQIAAGIVLAGILISGSDGAVAKPKKKPATAAAAEETEPPRDEDFAPAMDRWTFPPAVAAWTPEDILKDLRVIRFPESYIDIVGLSLEEEAYCLWVYKKYASFRKTRRPWLSDVKAQKMSHEEFTCFYPEARNRKLSSKKRLAIMDAASTRGWVLLWGRKYWELKIVEYLSTYGGERWLHFPPQIAAMTEEEILEDLRNDKRAGSYTPAYLPLAQEAHCLWLYKEYASFDKFSPPEAWIIKALELSHEDFACFYSTALTGAGVPMKLTRDHRLVIVKIRLPEVQAQLGKDYWEKKISDHIAASFGHGYKPPSDSP